MSTTYLNSKTNRKPAAPTNRPRRKACQAVAKAVGLIASMLVALSVWHLTASIATLTGSALGLAFLLAVGIDLGLISCEIAELISQGNKHVATWARAYMAITTAISMALNAFEFAANAPEGPLTKGIAIAFGVLLPLMIFILARVAAHLYQAR